MFYTQSYRRADIYPFSGYTLEIHFQVLIRQMAKMAGRAPVLNHMPSVRAFSAIQSIAM